jgi:hypothetical protein
MFSQTVILSGFVSKTLIFHIHLTLDISSFIFLSIAEFHSTESTVIHMRTLLLSLPSVPITKGVIITGNILVVFELILLT